MCQELEVGYVNGSANYRARRPNGMHKMRLLKPVEMYL